MKNLPQIFESNRRWAKQTHKDNPNLFEDLSDGQNPDYLWIGCADSRVPANQITDLPPGNLFVHRNIANVVLHSDINCQSVLQYAVEMLEVKHIIICGHYGCGGVKAAFEDQNLGLIDHWLSHIQDNFEKHLDEIKDLGSKEEKLDRLCEINVYAQVANTCRSPFLQKAWEGGQDISVHGLIYNLDNGQLQDLDLCISSAEEAASLE